MKKTEGLSAKDARRRANGFVRIVEIKYAQNPMRGYREVIAEAMYEHLVAKSANKKEG